MASRFGGASKLSAAEIAMAATCERLRHERQRRRRFIVAERDGRFEGCELSAAAHRGAHLIR